MAERRAGAIRRQIAFDAVTWHALDRRAKDRMETIKELADETFCNLLKKHRRPTTLSENVARKHPRATQTMIGSRIGAVDNRAAALLAP